MTIRPDFKQSLVSRIPDITSFTAFTTRQPLRRSTSMKLAAEGSTITAAIFRSPAKFPSADA